MTGVVMHYALFGQIPPLDSQGRPKQFYGNRIHDTCYRRAFFDSGLFVEEFDDDASKAGWCLYKVGCRGPQTYNSCGNLRWWNGLSYPIQSGHGCIGCSEKASGITMYSTNDYQIFHWQTPLLQLIQSAQ